MNLTDKNIKRMYRFSLAMLLLLYPIQNAQAVGDGARAYQLLPVGSDTIALYGLFTHGNQTADAGTIVKSGVIDVSLGVLQYTHSFTFINNQQSALFAIQPFGEIEGSLNLKGSRSLNGSSSGLGDLQLGAVFGIVGSPPLCKKEYAAYKPGLSVGLLGKVFLPTGEYDENKALNLGANRWGTQLGAIGYYYFGSSLVDPSLTVLEVLPTVSIYTDNTDPYNAVETEQAAIFNIETHIVRYLTQAIWISLDTLYTYGGETTTDGVDDDNIQSSFFLGATASMMLSKSLSLKLSYGDTLSHKDGGADGSMIRGVLNFVF